MFGLFKKKELSEFEKIRNDVRNLKTRRDVVRINNIIYLKMNQLKHLHYRLPTTTDDELSLANDLIKDIHSWKYKLGRIETGRCSYTFDDNVLVITYDPADHIRMK